jgi:hypothetical protein
MLTLRYKPQSEKLFQQVQRFSSIKKMVGVYFKSRLIIYLLGPKG